MKPLSPALGKGFFWMSSLRGSLRVITILRTAVLARIISKPQFGLFGIITLSLSLLEMLTETGINVFLIQEKENLSKYLNTAWLVSILRGLLIFLLIVLVNPFIATFFKAPDSRLYLYAISLVPLLRGFINPACIKLQKELLFRLEFLYRFAIIGFETLVTIVISFFYPTAMALIVGLILSAFLEVSLSFILFSPRPIWGFDSRQFKIILHRGKWITGMGILDYLFTTGDNIIVGRLLGTGALGVYQNAYKISTIPTFETQDIFYKVTFPVYVKANMAFGLNRRLLIRNVAFYCLIVTVFGLVVSLMAKPLVHILLGPDWSEAVPVVRILGILGISRGISFSFNSIFMTFQKQKYVTLIILTSVLGLALTIVPAVTRFGLSGAGISAVFGSLLSLPLALYFAVRIISRL